MMMHNSTKSTSNRSRPSIKTSVQLNSPYSSALASPSFPTNEGHLSHTLEHHDHITPTSIATAYASANVSTHLSGAHGFDSYLLDHSFDDDPYQTLGGTDKAGSSTQPDSHGHHGVSEWPLYEDERLRLVMEADDEPGQQPQHHNHNHNQNQSQGRDQNIRRESRRDGNILHSTGRRSRSSENSRSKESRDANTQHKQQPGGDQYWGSPWL